ncbi:MAG: YdjY domain-containing protein [Proteobacteria bacterium]|nr:YdjY domain-containing protein [Pseudomonadota bacterium]
MVKTSKVFLFILVFLCSKAFSVSLNVLPIKEKPLIIDERNKAVLIYTEVNVMHLYQPTVHWGVVFKDGRFGDRAILKAYCNQLDFYDALIKIGAKPGNNLNKDSVGKYVEGDELIVTAIVNGKEYQLENIFKDSSGRGFRIKFGGNRLASEEQKTGCITCLESCWISITSNANYPMTNSIQRFITPNSYFRGNDMILPAKDGYPVILIYKLK